MNAPYQVLVVDDDPLVRRVVVRMVEQLGFVAVGVEGLTAARVALAGGPIDLVLCDVDLGDGTGVDLAAELLADGKPPVVLMSGSEPVLAHARATLGVKVMCKPFDRAALGAILRLAGLTPVPAATR